VHRLRDTAADEPMPMFSGCLPVAFLAMHECFL
jgi:hypothetical protein